MPNLNTRSWSTQPSMSTDQRDGLKNRIYPSGSGRGKALLMACSYQHVHDPTIGISSLKYSMKDPFNLQKLLLSMMYRSDRRHKQLIAIIENGYKRENITILVDDGDNPETYPTRANMVLLFFDSSEFRNECRI